MSPKKTSVIAAIVIVGSLVMLYARSGPQEARLTALENANIPAVAKPGEKEAGGVVAKLPRNDELMGLSKEGDVPNDYWGQQPARGGVLDPSDPLCYVPDPNLFKDLSEANKNRCAPHWFVVGCLKTGTTSIYSYIAQHPQVKTLIDSPQKRHSAVRIKEPSYFNARTERSINEYWTYFPLIRPGDHMVTGEASPGYIFWHDSPERLLTTLPQARLAVLIREPITRAFSRVNHILSMHLHNNLASFPVAAVFDKIVEDQLPYVKACLEEHFPRDIQTYKEFVLCSSKGSAASRKAFVHPDVPGWDKRHDGAVLQCYGVRALEHSLYWMQILNWQWHLEKHGRPKEDLLVLRSETFYEHTPAVMTEVTKHMLLDPIDWEDITNKKYNVGAVGNDKDSAAAFDGKAGGFVAQRPDESHHEVTAATQKLLEEFYAPYNKMLEEVLGRAMWSYDE